jgi:Planctomycete cytochrome C
MKTLILTIGLSTLSAAAIAADVDVSKLPPAAKKTGVTWDADIKPIFEKSCIKCHSGEKPKAKFRADTKENILKGADGEKVLEPGNSAKSEMVHLISDLVADEEMPPLDKRDKYPALTKEQVGLVRAWIDQGAK